MRKKGYNTLDIYFYLCDLGGIFMKGHLVNQYGEVVIDLEVIKKYAGSTAVECFGIVGMAAISMKDGLVKLLKGDSLTRGIYVTVDEDNKLCIDFHVIMIGLYIIISKEAKEESVLIFLLEKTHSFLTVWPCSTRY